MSLVPSFQVLADICPHHKPIRFGTVLGAGSPCPRSVQCWNSRGCRCVGRIALPKLVQCLPARCLALLLATSVESYFRLQSKEDLKGKTVFCLFLALYVTFWQVWAFGGTGSWHLSCWICCKLLRLLFLQFSVRVFKYCLRLLAAAKLTWNKSACLPA